jgi:hypothetical protein
MDQPFGIITLIFCLIESEYIQILNISFQHINIVLISYKLYVRAYSNHPVLSDPIYVRTSEEGKYILLHISLFIRLSSTRQTK